MTNKYRGIYEPDDLWEAAQKATALSMSKLIRILLQAVVDGKIEVTVEGEVKVK